MIFVSLLLGTLFLLGFLVMAKELIKAPVGHQDGAGFHLAALEEQVQIAVPARTKLRRERWNKTRRIIISLRHAHGIS